MCVELEERKLRGKYFCRQFLELQYFCVTVEFFERSALVFGLTRVAIICSTRHDRRVDCCLVILGGTYGSGKLHRKSIEATSS